MRKLLLISLLLLPLFTNAQRLTRDGKDKYTDKWEKETSEVTLAKNGLTGAVTVKGKSVDGQMFLGIQPVMPNVYSISEGDKVYILLDNGDKVVLESVNTKLPTHNQGYWHTYYYYPVNEQQHDKLLKSKVTGIRVDMTDKYTSWDKVKAPDGISKVMSLIRVTN